MRVALTIAGSDSGGGAGIQADIKAMQANGVFAASVIAAITAQNTQEVTAAFELPVDIIEAQLDAVFDDIDVHAVKTGMLSSASIIEAVAKKLETRNRAPLVVDPVMISKSGYALLHEDAIDTLKRRLLPLASIVTPNAHEARFLSGVEVRTARDARGAAETIAALGARAVLIKGGHLDDESEAIDVLFDGEKFEVFSAPRIVTKHTHGTGCTYASAIAANLAKGHDLHTSVDRAKDYVTKAIQHGFALGGGHGPTDAFYYLRNWHAFPFQ